jgi:hypothetical protein
VSGLRRGARGNASLRGWPRQASEDDAAIGILHEQDLELDGHTGS